MPNFLDLFAGAGGLSEGFIRAGYEPVAHVEMDRAACFTLKTRAAYHWLKSMKRLDVYQLYMHGEISRDVFYGYIPDEVLNTVLNYEISADTLQDIFNDVDKLLNGKKLDLIIGGPPCQAYSIVGRSRDQNHMVGDKRNYLYQYYAKFLERYKPQYFVFENVVGLLSAREQDGTLHFDNMRNLFQQCGYTTDFKVLNSSDFGVLQNRKRIILIGVHGDKKFYPQLYKIENNCTVNDLLCDLPAIHSGEGKMTLVKTNHYARQYLYEAGIKEYDEEEVTYHQSRPNKKTDLEIYRQAVETWNKEGKRISYTDIPQELRTHQNTKSFLDRFKVVAGNLPYAQTVVAHLSRDGHYFIHPDIDQNRSLTPREAARIQTFPDNFYFESQTGIPSRTLAFKQIGNAVPVRLAYEIAKALRGQFTTVDLESVAGREEKENG